MSRLLDALEKAEGASPPPPTAAAANEAAREAATPRLIELAARLDATDAALAAAAATGQEAREPRPATLHDDARRTSRRIGIAAGLVVVAIGSGFWWLAPTPRGALAAAAPPPAAAALSLPASPVTPATAPIVEAAPPPPRVGAGAVPRAAAPAPAQAAAGATAAADTPLRLSRSRPRVAPALARAYEQLLADDVEGAETAYGEALRDDPRSVDALLGMASIALHRELPQAAEEWFLQALAADPKNVDAQAGLLNLRGAADPSAAESRLKSLLAAQPETATLHFALGNLYAGQQRWAEAQQAYFSAYAADGTNPDYLFNLAASLDHLHLPQLALGYYRAALAAGAGRRAAFDAARVRARIAEIAP
ncbi:tetratricopeptide repeat protein [Azospira restricta]|uniref:Tetratricopeptide repeat protein n=1 Tax=Azospira restricta TaxID=404405 RepID=A0A974Y395_9RHOO|nr:tetratricopeptide repeat protein [Azospira restricta]QRJ63696.1 tetratricopeptide repeat protein [Azospira restricta]